MFSALGQISKHSVDLAELVVEAEIFPAVLACLRDPDEYVRKNVTTLMREITKHTPEVGYPPTPDLSALCTPQFAEPTENWSCSPEPWLKVGLMRGSAVLQ